MADFQKNLMDDAQKAIETEKLIKQTKPYARPEKSYETTLARHQNAKTRALTVAKSNNHQLKLNQVTAPKHCSLRTVKELTPIRLKDMFVNQVHTGKYLMCRVVGEPFYLTGIITVVEDESGDIENVSLYNYSTSYDISPIDLLPVNSVIIIKEPYLKIMISNNSDYYIRVESPTDVVFVNDHGVEKWKPFKKTDFTYEQLNELGNKCFVKKEYRQAIRYYSQALNVEKNPKTYSNRAAAELELEMFIEAFKDAQESSSIEPSEKAYYRMGRAAYAMRQYELAAENFSKCVKLNEKNTKAVEDLKRCEDRLKEAQTGVYDMKKLIGDVKAGLLRLDVADYVCKSIAVKEIPNKSKGIVAVEKIKRGTLLVSSKAASIAYDSECKFKVVSANFYTKKMDQPSNNQNLVNLFYKLQHDPYLAEKLYELYPGEEIDRSQKVPEGIVDSCRAELILTYNSFITQDQKDFVSGAASGEGMEENSGIWIFPSYFNHSCVPNTIRIYLKDFVLFYAFKDIELDEELTIQYCGLSSYSEREKIANQKICSHFGFKCACRLCEMDRADPNYNSREALLTKNQQIMINLATTDEKYIQKYIQMVKNTYREGQELQYRLSIPMVTLASFYRMRGHSIKAAQTFMQLFEILKDCDSVFSSMLLIQTLNCYLQEGMLKEASQTLKIAKGYFVGSVDYYNYVYDINNFCLP